MTLHHNTHQASLTAGSTLVLHVAPRIGRASRYVVRGDGVEQLAPCVAPGIAGSGREDSDADASGIPAEACHLAGLVKLWCIATIGVTTE